MESLDDAKQKFGFAVFAKKCSGVITMPEGFHCDIAEIDGKNLKIEVQKSLKPKGLGSTFAQVEYNPKNLTKEEAILIFDTLISGIKESYETGKCVAISFVEESSESSSTKKKIKNENKKRR